MRPDFGPHFLIATDTEAATGSQHVELDDIDAFAAWDDGFHGLGAEELAELHCLAVGRVSDQSVLDGYQEVFASSDTHGPWLVRIPDEFVTALASLSTEQLASIGERWLEASREFQFRQTPKEWVQRLGVRLAELARRAADHHKSMYWEPPSC